MEVDGLLIVITGWGDHLIMHQDETVIFSVHVYS